jgi:hypothetical protein
VLEKSSAASDVGVIEAAFHLLLRVAALSSSGHAALIKNHVPAIVELAATDGASSWYIACVQPLLFHVLSDERGIKVLLGWVASELARWDASNARGVPTWVAYVTDHDEVFAACVAAPDGGDDGGAFPAGVSSGAEIPHLCAALCCTRAGSELLVESALYRAVATALTNEQEGLGDTTRTRAALLAVGFMGSTACGFRHAVTGPLLDALSQLLTHGAMSVRGAAIAAVSMMARHARGCEALEASGFSVAAHQVAYTLVHSRVTFATSFGYPEVPEGEGEPTAWLGVRSDDDAAPPPAPPLDVSVEQSLRFPLSVVTPLCCAVSAKHAQAVKRLDELKRAKPHLLAAAQAQADVTQFAASRPLRDVERCIIALFFFMPDVSHDDRQAILKKL